jgi:hypothetical protein
MLSNLLFLTGNPILSRKSRTKNASECSGFWADAHLPVYRVASGQAVTVQEGRGIGSEEAS